MTSNRKFDALDDIDDPEIARIVIEVAERLQIDLNDPANMFFTATIKLVAKSFFETLRGPDGKIDTKVAQAICAQLNEAFIKNYIDRLSNI